MTFWCDHCHKECFSWRKDTPHWGADFQVCPGKVVAWDPELPPIEGWQTECPALPDDNAPRSLKERWWFWGAHRDHATDGFELTVVVNVLLGSGTGAWQAFQYHSDFVKPESLKGYWKRLDDPDHLPPVPALPKKVDR